MTSDTPLEDRILDLFTNLKIDRAHIAGRVPADWSGLVTNHPEAVASLTLVCPANVPSDLVHPIESTLLIFSGDQGSAFDALPRDRLPDARFALLSDFETMGWTDVAAERSDEILTELSGFLEAFDVPPMDSPDEPDGEVGGVSYRVRGKGPPLVLLPLMLAPSQWEPIVPALSEQFTTITLGGPFLGPVLVLEARGQSVGYRQMLNAMFDQMDLTTGGSVLEVGCGSGAVMRCLVDRTQGRNELTGVDISTYLLGEGRALAQKAEFHDVIATREGSALSIPFDDNHFDTTYSVTVIEEVDADKMIDEMIRVTKPGGSIGVICRAVDLTSWANAHIDAELRAKIEATAVGSVEEHGCADASLYRRFRDAGLKDVVTFPHLTPFTRSDSVVIRFMEGSRLADATPEEKSAWSAARAQAEADGSFFITWPPSLRGWEEAVGV